MVLITSTKGHVADYDAKKNRDRMLATAPHQQGPTRPLPRLSMINFLRGGVACRDELLSGGDEVSEGCCAFLCMRRGGRARGLAEFAAAAHVVRWRR